MDDQLTTILRIVRENIYGYDEKVDGVLTPDSTLIDVGADSIDSVAIIIGIEDHFDLLIHDEDSEAAKTVADLDRLVTRLRLHKRTMAAVQ